MNSKLTPRQRRAIEYLQRWGVMFGSPKTMEPLRDLGLVEQCGNVEPRLPKWRLTPKGKGRTLSALIAVASVGGCCAQPVPVQSASVQYAPGYAPAYPPLPPDERIQADHELCRAVPPQ